MLWVGLGLVAIFALGAGCSIALFRSIVRDLEDDE